MAKRYFRHAEALPALQGGPFFSPQGVGKVAQRLAGPVFAAPAHAVHNEEGVVCFHGDPAPVRQREGKEADLTVVLPIAVVPLVDHHAVQQGCQLLDLLPGEGELHVGRIEFQLHGLNVPGGELLEGPRVPGGEIPEGPRAGAGPQEQPRRQQGGEAAEKRQEGAALHPVTHWAGSPRR